MLSRSVRVSAMAPPEENVGALSPSHRKARRPAAAGRRAEEGARGAPSSARAATLAGSSLRAGRAATRGRARVAAARTHPDHRSVVRRAVGRVLLGLALDRDTVALQDAAGDGGGPLAARRPRRALLDGALAIRRQEVRVGRIEAGTSVCHARRAGNVLTVVHGGWISVIAGTIRLHLSTRPVHGGLVRTLRVASGVTAPGGAEEEQHPERTAHEKPHMTPPFARWRVDTDARIIIEGSPSGKHDVKYLNT